MEQIKQYQIIRRLEKYNHSVVLWEGENDEGERFEILTIAQDDTYHKLLDRLFANEVIGLKNEEIIGIQKIIETGLDIENQCHYIIYEALENFELLSKNRANATIQTLIELVKGLDVLKKRNLHSYFIAPQSICVDINGRAKLKFIGLFEFFKHQQLLDNAFLAPNVQAWIQDTKKSRPNFQDDIYSVIKCFEFLLTENSIKTGSVLLQKGLNNTRMERFTKYYDVIVLLEQLPNLQKQPEIIETPIELLEPVASESEHKSSRVVKLAVQPQKRREFEPIFDEFNEHVWFLLENSRSNDKNQLTGLFSTNNWNGRFFVDDKNHIFINFKGCKNEKSDKVIKNKQSFIAPFCFDMEHSNEDCVAFFEQKFEAQNQLAALQGTKTELVKRWQVLPEKEREYIEETAFSATFESRTVTHSNSSNIKFKLKGDSLDWSKIRAMKSEQVILFVNDQKVGKILDFHPKENFITIKDAFCTVDEIAEQGILTEDVRQLTSQFKKQVEACKKFETTDVVNPALCSILATPETTAMPNNVRLYEDDYVHFKEKVFNKYLQNDDTQREAVLEALHRKPLYLIQGPPGTGKTTVIVELIHQIITRQKEARILVTSQSNLAVDNVLERLANPQNEPLPFSFMRLASEGSNGNINVTDFIEPHTADRKLKNWVTDTEKKAQNYFSSQFATEEKQRNLIELYDYYSNLDKAKGWTDFRSRLDICHNFLRKMFEFAKNFKDVNQIFEKQLGSKFLKIRSLQKDWFAFLGGVMTEDDKERKKSMLNNGSSEIDFFTAMMQNVNIIGATCIHIASSKYNRVNFRFDYVIMDESSKASPSETLVPINMGQNIILIGDHKQLPPVITREDAVKKKVKTALEDNGLDFDKDFGESLFEKLIQPFETDKIKRQYLKMLDIQYRMPKQVGSLISKYFYDGKLKNPDLKVIPKFDEDKHHGLKFKKETSILFICTSQQKEKYDNDNKFNRQNKGNVLVIKEILQQLNQLYDKNLERSNPFTIGIIAGYRGQVDLLKQNIPVSQYQHFVVQEKANTTADSAKKTNLIEINTVDKFQGAERDIIIYDVVRSSIGRSNIGFLDDYRRINVAFSRVKRLLIVVGDSDYLINRATLNPNGRFNEFKLQQIVEDLKTQGLIFNNLNEILDGAK